jgi:hypothetical protein
MLLFIVPVVYSQNQAVSEDMTVGELIEALKKLKLSEFTELADSFFYNISEILGSISGIIVFLIIFWFVRHLWWFFSVQKIKKDLVIIREKMAGYDGSTKIINKPLWEK